MPIWPILDSERLIPFEDAVSLGQHQGLIPGRKFGESALLAPADPELDLWRVGPGGGLKINRVDIDINTPESIYFSSTSALDTVEMAVFATILNTDLGTKENVAMIHDLAGQTPTLLTYTDPATSTVYNTFSRVFRAANNNGSALAGNVYYSTGGTWTDGVPDSNAQIQAYVSLERQQTMMSHVFIPDNYWAVIKLVVPKIINEGNTSTTNGIIDMRVKGCGKTYLTKDPFPISTTGGGSPLVFSASEPIAPCSDIKFVITADSVGRSSTRFAVTYFFKLYRTDRINQEMFGVFS